ncbi:MAG: efflux RND transporter periplasmic adaptor subunit, partial [Propionivibrio sp.]|nr:efflux RND transporter periplasmic adaptor subunit [Propionivibrio sp.]
MNSNLLRGGVLLATILLFAGCGKPAAPPEPMRSVLTQIVGAAAESATATYAGEVRSRYETPLGFRIPGKVAARLVDVGTRVKAGDVLMRLDPSDTALTVAAATAKLNLAEADLERYRELRAKNFVSQAVLDAKETAYAATKAEADLAANQSAYTVLHADQNGVIAQVSAEVGQVVAAGQAVVKLARTDALEVAFAVPEARAQAVRSLKVAEVSLWAEGSRRYAAAL